MRPVRKNTSSNNISNKESTRASSNLVINKIPELVIMRLVLKSPAVVIKKVPELAVI